MNIDIHGAIAIALFLLGVGVISWIIWVEWRYRK